MEKLAGSSTLDSTKAEKVLCELGNKLMAKCRGLPKEEVIMLTPHTIGPFQ